MKSIPDSVPRRFAKRSDDPYVQVGPCAVPLPPPYPSVCQDVGGSRIGPDAVVTSIVNSTQMNTPHTWKPCILRLCTDSGLKRDEAKHAGDLLSQGFRRGRRIAGALLRVGCMGLFGNRSTARCSSNKRQPERLELVSSQR